MREQDWPDEAWDAAHEAAQAHIGDGFHGELAVEIATKMVIDVLTVLAPHVTPTAPLRELANGWGEDGDLCFPEKYMRELREMIDRA